MNLIKKSYDRFGIISDDRNSDEPEQDWIILKLEIKTADIAALKVALSAASTSDKEAYCGLLGLLEEQLQDE